MFQGLYLNCGRLRALGDIHATPVVMRIIARTIENLNFTYQTTNIHKQLDSVSYQISVVKQIVSIS